MIGSNGADLFAYFVSFHTIKIRSPQRHCVEEVPPQQLLKEHKPSTQMSIFYLQNKQMQLQMNSPGQSMKQVVLYAFWQSCRHPECSGKNISMTGSQTVTWQSISTLWSKTNGNEWGGNISSQQYSLSDRVTRPSSQVSGRQRDHP